MLPPLSSLHFHLKTREKKNNFHEKLKRQIEKLEAHLIIAFSHAHIRMTVRERERVGRMLAGGKSHFEPINWLLIKISAALSLSALAYKMLIMYMASQQKQHGRPWWTQLVVALLMIENYISAVVTHIYYKLFRMWVHMRGSVLYVLRVNPVMNAE